MEINRSTRNYSNSELVQRVLWGIGSVFFKLSFRRAFTYRKFILTLFGAKIGKETHIYRSAKIFLPSLLQVGQWTSIAENTTLYNLGKINIGDNTTVSQGVHLCAGTHNYQSEKFELVRATINIGSNVWLCADCFVGPHITVSDNAIVAARAVVTKSVVENAIVGGNPAKFIKSRY